MKEENKTIRCPKPGEFYRHFKNRLYQIVAVAIHSETEEKLVVYQALYGDFQVYARPLAMFLSEVDHEKYPNVTQRYRFERVMSQDIADSSDDLEEVRESEFEEQQANPYLLDFLAADTYQDKLRALMRMRGHVGQVELDSVALVLEIQPMRCDFQTQLDTFIKHVKTQQYYDGSRLR